MEYYIIPDSEALGQCAWCRSKIDEFAEVFGIGTTFKPGVDLSEFESHCIQIGLLSEEKPLYMMVTARDSEAKNDGKDGMFMVCSENCGKKLKKALEKEVANGKIFDSVRNVVP